ncbi:terminase [Salinisphaera sp. SPP-AMP-43]|uniref:terminase n=1 Tax=Salinisphaera sp. SPP-AMP-43 TaxID=3121288 RepID=UPI003C6E1DB3
MAWTILFIMSTRPGCKGVVTANTSDQLRTKTWAELAKWHRRCITRDWFVYSNSRGNMNIHHVDDPQNWRCDAQTCREENSESFAGLHAVNSTPFYIYDEASAVPNSIWEVSEGGMTDGEPMWFVFGNPTRTTGRFAECFGVMRHRWSTRKVDSREVQVTNKVKIAEWIEDYGEDHDFVRVRVRGEFPRVGDTQFIGAHIVTEAMARELDVPVFAHFPRFIGVDVARFGSDNSVIMRRQGPMVWKPKVFNRVDTMELVGYIVDEARDFESNVIFIDGVGVGGGVVDRLHQLGFDVVDVQSGQAAVDHKRFKNRRMELWYRMREWLDGDVSLPAGLNELRDDLTGPEYGFNDRQQMVLESVDSMKERGLASPDYASALAMTFADFSAGHRRAKAKQVRKVRWA